MEPLPTHGWAVAQCVARDEDRAAASCNAVDQDVASGHVATRCYPPRMITHSDLNNSRKAAGTLMDGKVVAPAVRHQNRRTQETP